MEPAPQVSLSLAGPSFSAARQRSPHHRGAGGSWGPRPGPRLWELHPCGARLALWGHCRWGQGSWPAFLRRGPSMAGLGNGLHGGLCPGSPAPQQGTRSPGESWVWIRRLLGTGLQGVPKGPQDCRWMGRGTAGQRELCRPHRVSQLRSGPTDPSSPGAAGPTPGSQGPQGGPRDTNPSPELSPCCCFLLFLGVVSASGAARGIQVDTGTPRGLPAGGRDLRPPNGAFWFSVQGEPGFRGPPVSRPRLPHSAHARAAEGTVACLAAGRAWQPSFYPSCASKCGGRCREGDRGAGGRSRLT